MRDDRARRGSILIAVLWSLFFLAALAAAINVLVTPQMGLAARMRDRTALRYLAQAGIRRAALEVRLDETEDYDALNDTWSRNEEAFKEISVDEEGYFSVICPVAPADGGSGMFYGLMDEESKINVNAMPVEILKQFFEVAAGTSSQEAEAIADAIADWRDEDEEPRENGAESPYYEGLESGYPCKNARLDAVEELLLVRGITPEVFDQIKDHVTVFGAGQININTAGPLVLQGLGMSPELAEKVVKARAGSDSVEGSEDDNIFENTGSIASIVSQGASVTPEEAEMLETILAGNYVSVRSDNFRGEAVAGFLSGGTSAKVVFVIHRNGQVRYWQEG